MTEGPSMLTVVFGYRGNSCEVFSSVRKLATQTLLHERLFGCVGVPDEENQKNVGTMEE
jgi:hypothetical protein